MFTPQNRAWLILLLILKKKIQCIQKLISFLPQNNMEEAPMVECTDPIDRLEDSLNDIIPDNPNKPYDMYEVLGAVIDNGEFWKFTKLCSQHYCWVCPLMVFLWVL